MPAWRLACSGARPAGNRWRRPGRRNFTNGHSCRRDLRRCSRCCADERCEAERPYSIVMRAYVDTHELSPFPTRTFRPRRLAFAFYVGVPLGLSLFSSTISDSYGRLLGHGGRAALCFASLPVPWWTVCATTALTRRWLPAKPLWMIAALGAASAFFLLLPYHQLVTELFRDHWPGGGALTRRGLVDSPDILEMLFRGTRTALIWVGVNYLFERLLGFAPYRKRTTAAPVESAAAAAQPAFLQRAKRITDPAAILAVKAEEHYVRLYTAQVSELIHCPFTSAIEQLGDQRGLRVHRSFWVAHAAIAASVYDHERGQLVLPHGLTVPVSRRHQEMVAHMRRSGHAIG